MQSLYESEFHPTEKLTDLAARAARTAGAGGDDLSYLDTTIKGLAEHTKEIDKLIVKHAPEWPLEQIAGIDRAVLRLGVYEVLFSAEVPPKVAINEAVELAKVYGGENSGSFVNGVLGTVYRGSEKYDPKTDKTDK